MEQLQHASFYFWATILVYGSWCGGAFHEARRANKRATVLEQELSELRTENAKIMSRLKSLENDNPYARMMRAK